MQGKRKEQYEHAALFVIIGAVGAIITVLSLLIENGLHHFVSTETMAVKNVQFIIIAVIITSLIMLFFRLLIRLKNRNYKEEKK